MKITFAVPNNGCGWWRAIQPANMIKKLGLAEVRVFDQTTMTDQDIEDMMKRLKALKNFAQVAREFSVNPQTVRARLAARFGQQEVDQWVSEDIPFSDEEKIAIKQQYANGIGPTAIAAKLNPQRSYGSVAGFLFRVPEPERSELRAQYQANASLKKSPQAATTQIYRAGRMDPSSRGPDWRVGRGYK